MAAGGEESIGELLARLRAEGEGFARAELRLVRARVADRVARLRTGVVLLLAAVVVALAVVIALPVGLIATLAPLIGPGLATLAVVGGGLLIAALLGGVGVSALKKALKPEGTR